MLLRLGSKPTGSSAAPSTFSEVEPFTGGWPASPAKVMLFFLSIIGTEELRCTGAVDASAGISDKDSGDDERGVGPLEVSFGQFPLFCESFLRPAAELEGGELEINEVANRANSEKCAF